MERSVLLDLLRITAIVLVFVAHFGQLLDTQAGTFFGIKNFYYVSLGGVGVTLFLVLSGVLAGLMDMQRPIFYPTYLFKKVLRIYPLYWMTIPLSMLGYVLNGLMMDGTWMTLFPNGFVQDISGSLTGFYALMGLWGGPYNPPSWFIVLIMTLYIVFPVMAYFMRRASNITLLSLLIISLLSRWYVGQYGVPFVPSNWFDDIENWAYQLYGFMPGRPGDWFVLCRLFEFGLGVWLALTLTPRVWAVFNGLPHWLKRSISVLSDLSFPLFLLHYPFLFLAVWLSELGMNVSVAIVILIALLLLMALYVQKIDNKMPHKAWLAGINRKRN